MAEMNFPDIMGSFQRGYAFGSQQKAMRKQEQDEAQLRSLAPQVIAGDAGAFNQAAAISPDAAAKYQTAGNSQLRKLKGFVDFVDQARASGNMMAVNAALREGAPFISQIIGKPGPTEWTPDMEPGWQQLKARVAMADFGAGPGGRVQSRFTNDQGEVIALMADGTMVKTGEKAAPNIKILEQEGQVPTGYVTSGGRAGAMVPLGGAAPIPQPQSTGGLPAAAAPQAASAPGINLQIDGIPAEIQRQIAGVAAAMKSAGASDDAIYAYVDSQLPNSSAAPSGPVRTPTAAETAAAKAQAEIDTKLKNADAVSEADANAASAKSAAEARAKAQVERETNEPARQEKVRQIVAKIDAATEAVDRAVSQIDWTTAGFIGAKMANVPGTPAYDLKATANTIKANLAFDTLQQMREASPTGGALGAVSERELALLESAVASIDQAQSPEQLRESLGRVKEHYNNWKQAVRAADVQAQQRVTPPPSGSDPLGIL